MTCLDHYHGYKENDIIYDGIDLNNKVKEDKNVVFITVLLKLKYGWYSLN